MDIGKPAGGKLPHGDLWARTLKALDGAPETGLGIDEVAALIGRSYATAKTTLWRLEKRKQCYRISKPGYAAAYFGTEAARDAARPAVEERFARIGRERHEAARLRQRARERVRDGRPPDAPDRPSDLTCSEFLAGYLQSILPNGVSLAQATQASGGRSYHSVKKSMARLVQIGESAWSISRPGFAVYFGSREARDAAEAAMVPKPKTEPKQKAAKKPRTEKQQRYEFRRKELDARPKPKAAPPKVIGLEEAPRIVCPPCQLDRFTPPDSFRGEFGNEWLRLRAGGGQ
jgi:hypothetical protein